MTSQEHATKDIRVIIGTVLIIAIPAVLTLMTARVPVTEALTTDDPTPWGYTVSLLLFIVPVLLVGIWHLRDGHRFDKKAFIWVSVLMASLGAVLDFAFGYAFLAFNNPKATMRIRLPAWSWEEMGWIKGYLPVEEFAFYIFGSIFMVSAYLWADANWVSRYEPGDYEEQVHKIDKVIKISPQAIAVWAVFLVAGLGYRYMSDGGFPGYFVFLMCAGVLPSVVLVRNVKQFVNWHALAFSFGTLVFISVIWEASLALPYGWWAYRHEEMLGIYFVAWANLPLEAVMLWLVGVWDAVMFYELFRILFHKDEPIRHGLFGRPAD